MLEYSTFATDGQPELAMVVFNPSGAEDRARVRALIAEAAFRERRAGSRGSARP